MEYKRVLREEEKLYRITRNDVIRIFGKELKREGFDLSKEFYFYLRTNFENFDRILSVFQDEKFKVRGEFEIVPCAIW